MKSKQQQEEEEEEEEEEEDPKIANKKKLVNLKEELGLVASSIIEDPDTNVNI